MTNKIVYHVKDLDGHCSGALARYYYEVVQEELTVMVPFDYGYDIPKFDEDDRIVFVDIALQPNEIMLELAKKHEMIVVDHHKTFIDFVNSSDLTDYAEVYAENGKAACEIFYENFLGDGERIPRFVKLLGRYDVWDQSDIEIWEREILPFQYGCRTLNLDPQTEKGFERVKVQLFAFFAGLSLQSDFIESTISKGKTILTYQSLEDAKHVAHFSFEADFDGLRAICINSTRFNSQLFDSAWDSAKYDVMVCFANAKGKYYQVSLYSPKPDVAVGDIARAYGGGGHNSAAGFKCNAVGLEDGRLKIKQ